MHRVAIRIKRKAELLSNGMEPEWTEHLQRKTAVAEQCSGISKPTFSGSLRMRGAEPRRAGGVLGAGCRSRSEVCRPPAVDSRAADGPEPISTREGPTTRDEKVGQG